jgi:DNA invertase Pin-like site-specific DNA recombinase
MGRPGFEPGTNRLKAEYSTVELATQRWVKIRPPFNVAYPRHPFLTSWIFLKIVAYSYSDPGGEVPPEKSDWGWEVDRVYQDYDPDRPQFQSLLSDCDQEKFDYLLLRRLEELGESVVQVGDRLSALQRSGVKILVLDQDAGAIVSDFPAQTSPLLTLLANLEAAQRSRQIRRGHARNRLKSLPPPGKPPYGYRRGKERYILDRAAAIIVKDFVEYFLLYGSLRGAVRHLQKKHAKQISATTGRRWLTHPVYRGDLVYRNQEILRNTHAPILDREAAAQVDRLLRRNRSLPSRSASAPRSLAGLVNCDRCQSSLGICSVTAPRRPQDYLYLRPTACPLQPKCRGIAYDLVLQQTIALICQELPTAIAQVDLPRAQQAQHQITADIQFKQSILRQLPALVEAAILDPATAELRSYKLLTEIAHLENKLAQLPPLNLRQIAQTISIPQFWLDLSESERRFYFREFIRQISLERFPDRSWQLKLIFMF